MLLNNYDAPSFIAFIINLLMTLHKQKIFLKSNKLVTKLKEDHKSKYLNGRSKV